jgi:hypothetical protein
LEGSSRSDLCEKNSVHSGKLHVRSVLMFGFLVDSAWNFEAGGSN